MDKRELGKTGMQVGVIAFGGIVVMNAEPEDAKEYVAMAVARGVNYFDVAPSYGNAQDVLGPALAPYRQQVYLACKTAKRTAAEAQAELEGSLRALQTDGFDNYQLHGLDDPKEIETVFAPGGAIEVLLAAKKSGVAKNIGFTCHHDASALEILRRAEAMDIHFDTMLFPVNYAYRLQKSGSRAAVDACRERGMGIVAIKALARRKWLEGEEREYPHCWYRPIYDDNELARLALNYTLTQPGVTLAVPPGNVRMLRLALDLIEQQDGHAVPLTAAEEETLTHAALAVQDVIF